MEELRWEDPPRTRARSGRKRMYTREAEALRQQPGRWLLLCVKPTSRAAASMASKIGRRVAYLDLHGAEAVACTVNGEPRVYVRWPKEEP